MSRPVLLFSGQWTDLPLEELVPKVADWGYQGLELCCWGDHFEVQRAASQEEYCEKKLELLGKYELQVLVLANHKVSQALCDPIDRRHKGLLPDYVWGDGDPAEVKQRASEEMLATIQSAQKLGVGVVSGFSGSPIWSYVNAYPLPEQELISESLARFAETFNPLLDACQEANLRYAYEVHPGQLAFDIHSAEAMLDAIHGREELGFTFDPSHLHWMGIDPVEFLLRFSDRIYHVHIKDAVVQLSGRSSILNSHLPYGDPRRGWDFRAPGRGGIEWERVFRGLHTIGYEGPLSVEFKDAALEREAGAEEARQFVARMDFERAPRPDGQHAFRSP